MIAIARFGPWLTGLYLCLGPVAMLFLASTIEQALEEGGRAWWAAAFGALMAALSAKHWALTFYQWVIRRGPKLWIEGEDLIHVHRSWTRLRACEVIGVSTWRLYAGGWPPLAFLRFDLKGGGVFTQPMAGFAEGQAEVLRRLSRIAIVNTTTPSELRQAAWRDAVAGDRAVSSAEEAPAEG